MKIIPEEHIFEQVFGAIKGKKQTIIQISEKLVFELNGSVKTKTALMIDKKIFVFSFFIHTFALA